MNTGIVLLGTALLGTPVPGACVVAPAPPPRVYVEAAPYPSPPAPGVVITTAVVLPGVVPGPAPIGPAGAFVPAPPGSRPRASPRRSNTATTNTSSQMAERPVIRRISTSTTAMTSSTWMKPPIVVDVTSPRSQRMIRTTARV